MRLKLGFLAAAVAACCVGTSVQAAQILLNPSDVIGGSGSYGGSFNSGQFNATQILDNQTGPVTEPSQNGYWLNPDNGPSNAYITVDLGQAYKIGEIDLYNTHNAQYYDRGTGQFQILAGNSIADTGGGNYKINDPNAVVLLSDTLAAASTDPIPAQTFTVSKPGSYRYLEFDPLSVAAVTNGGAGCCGANNYGLNELRVFEATSSPVPEPASLSLLGLGVLGLAGYRCRRVKATA